MSVLERIRPRGRVKAIVGSALSQAGIELDGSRPFDVRVNDDRFFYKGFTSGLTSIRDAYVAGWWDTDRLDELTHRFISSDCRLPFTDRMALGLAGLRGFLMNKQSVSRAEQVRSHYDLDDDLFAAMLDSRMIYSCGYWRNASTLEEAQEAKLDLICRKLELAPGMRLLDLGCGWGGLAKFAAERYKVSVVGVTISVNQASFAREDCAELPVEIRLADYRSLAAEQATYDAVASVGMFEHVGYKNYRRFMDIVGAVLKPGGLALVHTIGGSSSCATFDPWLNKNIFPNAHLPGPRQIMAASEGVLVLEDWQNFGPDYDTTLMAWHERFEAAWPQLRQRYGERFRRMWSCYLLTCAGSFRARKNQLWQIVFSSGRRKDIYLGAR